MVSVYDYADYRAYLTDWIRERKGATQGKLANAAGVSSSLISLILKGDKHLSLEQAAELAAYIGLTEKETEYFYLLVEYGRAGTLRLQKQLRARIEAQRKSLANRISRQVELSDEVKAIYYSSWIYAAVRNLVALPGEHDVLSVAKRLALPPPVVANAIDFLLNNNLCKLENGKLTYGPQKTHVRSDSPFVSKHHQNWRLRGFQMMEERKDHNLFFTSPMSLSKAAAQEVHQLLPKLVEQVMGIAGPSESETVYCFNLDWFEY